MLKDVYHLLIERWSFFSQLLWQHIQIAGTASLLAAFFGILLGLFIAERGKFAPWVIQTNNVLYTIPSISMFGFLIPFSGIGDLTAVIALTLYGLLPMIGNTYSGMKNIDPAIIDAAKGMGSSKQHILWRIKLPLALPLMISALRTMLVMTIALAGIASFVGAGGLGVAIYRGITTNNSAMTITGSLLIMLLAFIADALCAKLEKMIPWRKQHEKN